MMKIFIENLYFCNTYIWFFDYLRLAAKLDKEFNFSLLKEVELIRRRSLLENYFSGPVNHFLHFECKVVYNFLRKVVNKEIRLFKNLSIKIQIKFLFYLRVKTIYDLLRLASFKVLHLREEGQVSKNFNLKFWVNMVSINVFLHQVFLLLDGRFS